MHFDDIMEAVLELFPNAELGQDSDGQLTVHTDFFLSETEDDTYYPGSEA